MKTSGDDRPPCTVTADYAIKLLRPTPTNGPVSLTAKVVESAGSKATVEGTLSGGGKVCATCRGTFVAVKGGHPAFHRWGGVAVSYLARLPAPRPLPMTLRRGSKNWKSRAAYGWASLRSAREAIVAFRIAQTNASCSVAHSSSSQPPRF